MFSSVSQLSGSYSLQQRICFATENKLMLQFTWNFSDDAGEGTNLPTSSGRQPTWRFGWWTAVEPIQEQTEASQLGGNSLGRVVYVTLDVTKK
jgi:hypothetical protein